MDSEKGSTLLAVLIGFLTISVVLLSLLDTARMDIKMSANDAALLQARQAVDGGVAWACEETYSELAAGASIKALPGLPVKASIVPVDIGGNSDQVNYTISNGGVYLIEQGSDYCIYEFGCEGSSRGATQDALIRVKYKFTDLYQDNAGTKVFYCRSFTDHGEIIYYQALDSGSSL